jgi:hypothetical protein
MISFGSQPLQPPLAVTYRFAPRNVLEPRKDPVMSRFTRIQDLSAEEIESAIASTDVDLGVDDLLAVQDFIEQIGGIGNARLAIEMLSKLEDAA